MLDHRILTCFIIVVDRINAGQRTNILIVEIYEDRPGLFFHFLLNYLSEGIKMVQDRVVVLGDIDEGILGLVKTAEHPDGQRSGFRVDLPSDLIDPFKAAVNSPRGTGRFAAVLEENFRLTEKLSGFMPVVDFGQPSDRVITLLPVQVVDFIGDIDDGLALRVIPL